MLSTIDKKSLWKQVVYEASDRLDPGLLHALLDQCYLDDLERGHARIIVRNASLQRMIEQKARKTLEKALEETVRHKVRVSILVGHPRIFERQPFNVTRSAREDERQEEELALLHQQYGDIMGIVDNHPVCRKATLPIERGGWGIFPQLLTRACREYGVMTILNGLRFIGNQTGIGNPRGAFFQALEQGRFGHKLAISADMVG